MTACSWEYAGLRSVSTYVLAVVGRRKTERFGSFQIVQCLIHEYRLAAACTKFANDAGEVGAQFAERSPFAHPGVPKSVTTGSMPWRRNPRRTASALSQS
jgi:hypothetical protein